MGNYDFKKDLNEAAIATKEALEHVKNHFKGIEDVQEHDIKEYDISGLFNGSRITFEFKNELSVLKTGNVAIEFQCRWKKSGIAATTSDYWLEKIRNSFYVIKTEALRQRIAKAEYDIVKFGGDTGSVTMFYLVEEKKFISWCEKI